MPREVRRRVKRYYSEVWLEQQLGGLSSSACLDGWVLLNRRAIVEGGMKALMPSSFFRSR